MKKTLLIGGLGVLAFLIFVAIKTFSSSNFVKRADTTFGNQHLKTAVALIELHKLRNGRYPRELSDIQFAGDWDRTALLCVDYRVDADGTSYFVEVKRGWIGKPDLEVPIGFWQGTGYNAALKPEGP